MIYTVVHEMLNIISQISIHSHEPLPITLEDSSQWHALLQLYASQQAGKQPNYVHHSSRLYL